MDDGPWIYESPDNGSTVLKRRVGNAVQWISIDGEWMRLDELARIAKEQKQEARLRERHTALAEAYDTYQALLALCSKGKDNV